MEWLRRHLANRPSLLEAGFQRYKPSVLRTMPRRSPPRMRPKIRCTTCEAANHDLHVSQYLRLRPTVHSFRCCTRAHTTRSAQLLEYIPCARKCASPSSAPQQRRPRTRTLIGHGLCGRSRQSEPAVQDLSARTRRRCSARISLTYSKPPDYSRSSS